MSYKPLQDQELAFAEEDSGSDIELVVFKKDQTDSEVRHRQEQYVSESEEDRDTKELIHDAVDVEEKGMFVDYEAVLRLIGFGLFHILLLHAIGVALSSDAVEILSISFVIPILKTELQLTGLQDGFLSTSMFLGMFCGGYLWGAVADITGRRRALIMSLTLNGVFGFMSALSPNFYVLLLFRFISGIG